MSNIEQLMADLGKRRPMPLPNPEPEVTVEKIGQQMKHWPDDAAAMPTELTRVSLFGLLSDKAGKQKSLAVVKLDSRIDIDVLYDGDRLNVKDETAWLACLRLGRNIPMGQRIYLKKSELLAACGLARTGQNWNVFKARLERLSKAHLTIDLRRGGKRYHMTTGMLKWGEEVGEETVFIRLDPDGATLFENLAYQPWDIRLSLHSDAAALILSYVVGHAPGKAHTVSLDDLRRWCGYEGAIYRFRPLCAAALSELEGKGVLEKGKSKISKTNYGERVEWMRVVMGGAIVHDVSAIVHDVKCDSP